MLTVREILAGLIAWAGASPALGGLSVTSYYTLAQTNGYAPVSQAQYFAEQRLENVSPALAEVSGDWTGPNADGTPDTWHFVGTARATSTTTITADSYSVTGAASFAYTLDTTAAFIDPASTSIFGPSGNALYEGFFQTDVPLDYALAAQLNQRGRVRLVRFGGPEIFDERNSTVVPRLLSLAGTIPPGQYGFFGAAGLGLGNQFNGVNHQERSGSFENLFFTVRVPEPNALGIIVALVVGMPSMRRPRTARR